MQDILSTSPIMSSRHQAASTPNSEITKAIKEEALQHPVTAFYQSGENTNANNSNNAAALAYTYNQRTSNFSVSNLANLDAVSSAVAATHQPHSWSSSSTTYPQYHKAMATFSGHHHHHHHHHQPYHTYQDLTAANNFYLRIPGADPGTYPVQQISPHAAHNNQRWQLPTSDNNNTNNNNANNNANKHDASAAYPVYSQLSSSQISSSSFNTSQSSSKSLSPKLTDFQATLASQGAYAPPVISSSSSSLSPLSSLGASTNSSLGNLSSSSGGGYGLGAQHVNLNAANAASSSSTNSSGSLPASSAESFEWMKPVKSQPNGKTRTKDKYRVVYTEPQRVELEKEFLYSKYITIKRKSELSQVLSLSERQIKIWFQNRRAKDRKTSRKQRLDANNSSHVTSTTRTNDYNDSEQEDDNDSVISIDMDEDSDHKSRTKKAMRSSGSTIGKPKMAGNSGNVSSDDLESVNKVKGAQASGQHSFSPYLQVNSNFQAFGGANMSPSGVSTFAGYGQLNSTPTYGHYFGSGADNQAASGAGNHFVGSCQPAELYQSYQYASQAAAAPLGQGLDYGAFQQQQQQQHVVAQGHDQYHYYQQQHLLLNGGSV